MWDGISKVNWNCDSHFKTKLEFWDGNPKNTLEFWDSNSKNKLKCNSHLKINWNCETVIPKINWNETVISSKLKLFDSKGGTRQ